jgi:SAM-dependent methyltransferase
VAGVVIDDMAATSLPPASFDAIVSVEVIEHVDDDAAFVANLYQTLQPGGVAILTTPNGDHDPIPRGDHRRHYRRPELEDLLARSFDDVRVGYAVAATRARMRGLASLDPRKPVRTAGAILGNITNRRESGRPAVPFDPAGTGNLLAVAFRRDAT